MFCHPQCEQTGGFSVAGKSRTETVHQVVMSLKSVVTWFRTANMIQICYKEMSEVHQTQTICSLYFAGLCFSDNTSSSLVSAGVYKNTENVALVENI